MMKKKLKQLKNNYLKNRLENYYEKTSDFYWRY